MPRLTRSASLTDYAKLARSCGLDAQRLVAEVGLPADCLREPDLKVPAIAVRRLLELSAQRSGVENFGLRLAEARRLSNLGPLALVVREEPTLRGALQALARYVRLQNEVLFLKIENADSVVIIRLGPDAIGREAAELSLGVLFRLLRDFLGPRWTPKRVCFTHSAPADRSLHRRVFGARVAEFGQDFNGIICAARDLDTPNPNADPVMARYVRQVVNADLRSPDSSVAHEVRELVIVLLPAGRCNAEVVAQHLGVDRRTVHRQLAREGKTFSNIVDATRRELATRYLKDGARSLTEVSSLLGFAAPSAFSRWYARSFGASPSSRRRQGG